KGKSTIIPKGKTVNVEGASTVNVEDTSAGNVGDTSAGNVEGTSANTKQKTTTEDIQIIKELDSLHLDTPPETVNSLRAYEKKPGYAQKFLDRMGDSFRWPTSMHENIRSQIFWAFTNEIDADEIDQEFALNCIYFYECLEKGLFNDHKEDWVLVYKQKVVKYGKALTNQQMSDLELEMPGALYFPVDSSLLEKIANPKIPPARAVHSQRSNDGGEYMIKVRVKRVGAEDTSSAMLDYQFNDGKNSNKLYKTVLDIGAPESILPYEIRSHLGKAGWQSVTATAPGYGAPAKLFLAKDPFQISIGDEHNWSGWVTTNTLRVRERVPGDQVDSSLVGNDVLDQLTYVHQKGGGLIFLNARHENQLGTFLNNLSP
ncbi:17610_t:CDS:2, partial [Funneliformis geosporum]